MHKTDEILQPLLRPLLDEEKLNSLVTKFGNASFDCGVENDDQTLESYRPIQSKAVAAREELINFVKWIAAEQAFLAGALDGTLRMRDHWKSNHDNMVKKCALLSQRDDLPVDRLPAYREMERLQKEVETLKIRLEDDPSGYDGIACRDVSIDMLTKMVDKLRDELTEARAKALQEVIDYANAHYGPVWSATIAGDIEVMKGRK